MDGGMVRRVMEGVETTMRWGEDSRPTGLWRGNP